MSSRGDSSEQQDPSSRTLETKLQGMEAVAVAHVIFPRFLCLLFQEPLSLVSFEVGLCGVV